MKGLVRLSLGVAILVLGMVTAMSCLGPVGFDPEKGLMITGSLDVRIHDSAVLWIVNTTKTVDVKKVTITSDDASMKDYPKINDTNGPNAGSSLAIYNTPTDVFYTIEVEYNPVDPPVAIQGVNAVSGSKSIRIQMPRANDYVLYVYRDSDAPNDIVLELGGDGTPVPLPKRLHSKDRADPMPPMPPTTNEPRSPIIFKNLSSLYKIIGLEFTPVGGGGTINFNFNVDGLDAISAALREGIYYVKAIYDTMAAGGTPKKTHPNGHGSLITIKNTGGSQFLYGYFYITVNGDVNITQNWPPLPGEPKPADGQDPSIIGTDQGLLRVINHSKKGSIIDGIMWGDIEYPVLIYPSDTAYESNAQDIPLPVGKNILRFKIQGNNFYGAMITNLEIKHSLDPTRVEYVDAMEEDNYIPPGAGAIKITNNTNRHMVLAVQVIDQNNLANYNLLGSNEFLPDHGVIGYKGGQARMLVQSQPPRFNLTGSQYLIQIIMGTEASGDDEVIVQRIEALLGKTVNITINQDEIDSYVAKLNKTTVNVNNQSDGNVWSVNINPASGGNGVQYPFSSFSTGAKIGKGGSASFTFMSSPALALVNGGTYVFSATLEYNGGYYTIYKSAGTVYTNTPYNLTITQADLEEVLPFVQVTNIILDPFDSLIITNGSTKTGTFTPTIVPANASFKNMTWKITGISGDAYTGGGTTTGLSGNFSVVGTNASNPRIVKLTATVPNGIAKGTSVTPGTPFVKEFEIFVYHDDPTVQVPTKLQLDVANFTTTVGKTLTLKARAWAGTVEIANPLVQWGFQAGKPTDLATLSQTGATSGPVTLTAVKNGTAYMKASVASPPSPGGWLDANFVVVIEPTDEIVKLIIRRIDTYSGTDQHDAIEIYRSTYIPSESNLIQGRYESSGTPMKPYWFEQILEPQSSTGKLVNGLDTNFPNPRDKRSDQFGLLYWKLNPFPALYAKTTRANRIQWMWDEKQYVVIDIENNRYGAKDGTGSTVSPGATPSYIYQLRYREHHGLWRGYEIKGDMCGGSGPSGSISNWFAIDVERQKQVARNTDGSIAFYYVLVDVDAYYNNTRFAKSNNLNLSGYKQALGMTNTIYGPLAGIGDNNQYNGTQAGRLLLPKSTLGGTPLAP